MNYWLVKSEPNDYSITDLIRDKTTNWDGVRNYQARNFLKQMKVGDLVFIYHSVKERNIVGIAQVTQEYFLDPTDSTGRFVAVKVKFAEKLKTPVNLSDLKADPKMHGLLLLKQSRLSVMPVTKAQWEHILKLGGK
jgi:predicted RNA-binding protein with PUA-like domain